MNKVTRKKTSKYTTISNVFLRDKNLSLKAKGFLTIIMALPDDWDFSIKGICSVLKEGKTAIYGVIQELKENHYCKTTPNRNEKGLILGLDYVFYEEPYDEEPQQDYPHSDNRYMDNMPQLNTYENKENKGIKDLSKKEEREESLSKKDELFEECWKAYRRKGSKSKAKSYWNKLKDDEKNRVLDHIKAYVSARDINYQQDFERYLRDKTFDSLVIKGNDILFDPTCATDTAYHPFGNYSILYDDISKQYIYIGYYDGRMSDGYTDDNRPDGATIILNSGRGTIVWSKAEQKWIHKKI